MSTKTTGKYSTATNTGSVQHLRQGTSHSTYLTMFNSSMPVIGLQNHEPIVLIGRPGEQIENVEQSWFDETMTVPSSGSIAEDLPEGKLVWVPNFKMKQETYLGVSKNYRNDTIYEDMPKFNGKSYIEDNGASMIYPYILANVSMTDPYQMDGVLEPLTIRDEISFSVLHGMDDHPHRVRGKYESGASTARGEDIQIKQSFYPGEEIGHLPWEDPTEYMGNASMVAGVYATGSISLNGFVAGGRVTTRMFRDASEVDAYMENAGLIRDATDGSDSNDGIVAAIKAMSPPTGNLLQPDEHSAAAGMTYGHKGGLGVGTDSLAFGGKSN